MMKEIYAKLLATSIFWGGTFVAGRIVAQEAEPLAGSFLRFALTSVVLAVIHRRGDVGGRTPVEKVFPSLVMLALTGVALYNIFFFLGLRTVSAGRAALIVANNPVFIALFSSLLFGERLGTLGIFGVGLCLVGAAVVISRGDPVALLTGEVRVDDLYVVGCVACWVAYSLIGRGVLRTLSPLTAVTWSCGIGAGLLFIPAVGEGLFIAVASYSVPTWLGIAYLAVFGTVLGFIWYYEGIRRLGAARAAVFINFVPVWAVLLGWVLLDERLNWSLAAGGVLVLMGVSLTNLRHAGLIREK